MASRATMQSRRVAPPYVFLSHSSRDGRFARALSESLSFYGIQVFFDERDIAVGESIPARVYEELGRATHVVVIVSRSSLRSAWVAEELSVAKMRQLGDAGCTVIPVVIDPARLPPSLSHVKYADFRHWQVRDAYYSSLRGLVVALGVQSPPATGTELHFVHSHLADLALLKELGDVALMTYDQVLKVHFDEARWQRVMPLKHDPQEARHALRELVMHYWNGQFFAALGRLQRAARLPRVVEIEAAAQTIVADVARLGDSPSDAGPWLSLVEDAQGNARALSSLIAALVNEAQAIDLATGETSNTATGSSQPRAWVPYSRGWPDIVSGGGEGV